MFRKYVNLKIQFLYVMTDLTRKTKGNKNFQLQ